MKNIKLFEQFINEAVTKFVWKRPNIERGMSRIGKNEDLREWWMFVNTEKVMVLHNWGNLPSSLRSEKAPVGWTVTIVTNGGQNIKLKEIFPSDKVEEAKAFCEEYYTMMTELGDDAPQELKDIKAKMKFPSRPKPKGGDFKEILPLLRAKLGDRFKWYISTNRISPPRTDMVYNPDTFNETGEFEWVDRRRDPKQMLGILDDALAGDWTARHIPGTLGGTIKIEKAH